MTHNPPARVILGMPVTEIASLDSYAEELFGSESYNYLRNSRGAMMDFIENVESFHEMLTEYFDIDFNDYKVEPAHVTVERAIRMMLYYVTKAREFLFQATFNEGDATQIAHVSSSDDSKIVLLDQNSDTARNLMSALLNVKQALVYRNVYFEALDGGVSNISSPLDPKPTSLWARMPWSWNHEDELCGDEGMKYR